MIFLVLVQSLFFIHIYVSIHLVLVFWFLVFIIFFPGILFLFSLVLIFLIYIGNYFEIDISSFFLFVSF